LKLSVVIPCYNEEKNIPHIIAKLGLFREPGMEVILVDNGSTDNTAEVLNMLLQDPGNAFIKTVKVEKNIGYGYGIMCGVRAANGDVIAWTHADLQTEPSDVLKAYELFSNRPSPETTFLKGVRKNRNKTDELFTSGMATLSSMALGQKLHDINAQPKMFHRSFLKLIPNPPDDFSLDLYVLYIAKQHKLDIIELPVIFKKRMFGEAKGGGSWKTKWKLVKRTFSYILKLKNEIKSGKR
jgi:glycosyltransferase involved in cell wall biosynthesis